MRTAFTRVFPLFFIFVFVISCQPKVDMQQADVVKILTDYGKQNTENKVLIKCKFGEIELKLYDETPLHRANFVRLIKEGYYDERIFYRVVKQMVVQGGAFNDDKLSYLVPAEFRPNLVHKRGALSMARYSVNNPQKMSSPAEFFIVIQGFNPPNDIGKEPTTATEIYKKFGGEPNFDQEYTVFGEVTKGLDVAERISKQEIVDIDKPLHKIRFSLEVIQ